MLATHIQIQQNTSNPKIKKSQTHYTEFCSLLKSFFSFPTELTKILLRMLTHASVKSA